VRAQHSYTESASFSKKVENHAHSIVLFAMYYNFVRVHKTLRMTPAMAANVAKRLWEMSDIIDVLEAWEAKARQLRPPRQFDYCGINVLPDGPTPVTCMITSPSLAQV
jgi:hypothetical protein